MGGGFQIRKRCVEHLLAVGADVNARDQRTNMTALHLAAQTNNAAVCLDLVRHHADHSIIASLDGKERHTALQMARRWGAAHAVRQLEILQACWRGDLLYEEHGNIAGTFGGLLGGDMANKLTGALGGSWSGRHAVILRSGPMQELALYRTSNPKDRWNAATPAMLVPLGGR